MAKKKLIHFKENLTFPHLFQPKYHELLPDFLMKDKWHSGFFLNDLPIVVELGCGKGEYTVGLARAYPDKNFIGIDMKGARLWRGCKTVAEQQLKNVAFVRTLVDNIERVFAPGEISAIWITFPDPQPKRERKRLTCPDFLAHYRNVLSPDGIIHLKTDDADFFQYTLGVVNDGGHHLLWSTDDLYHSGTMEDVITIQTYYEKIWLEEKKKICYVRFQLAET